MKPVKAYLASECYGDISCWGAVVIDGDEKHIVSGHDVKSSKETAEIICGIEVVRYTHAHLGPSRITMISEDKRFLNTIGMLDAYADNGWKNTNGNEVHFLWEQFYIDSQDHEIETVYAENPESLLVWALRIARCDVTGTNIKRLKSERQIEVEGGRINGAKTAVINMVAQDRGWHLLALRTMLGEHGFISTKDISAREWTKVMNKVESVVLAEIYNARIESHFPAEEGYEYH